MVWETKRDFTILSCAFQVWSVCACSVPTTPARRLQTGPAGTPSCWSTGRRRRSNPACRPPRWRARCSATVPEMSPRGTVASPTSATTRLYTFTQVYLRLCIYCIKHLFPVFWTLTELECGSAKQFSVLFCQQKHQSNLWGISHSFWSRLDEADADPPRSCDITNLAEVMEGPSPDL